MCLVHHAEANQGANLNDDISKMLDTKMSELGRNLETQLQRAAGGGSESLLFITMNKAETAEKSVIELKSQVSVLEKQYTKVCKHAFLLCN